jgi:hypothetical protein
MKHKKAKLLRRLVRGGADDVVVSDNVGSEKTISLSEVMDIFAPELEELTDALVNELRADGMPVERLEEMRQMGLKYNRRRKSFTTGEIGSF